MLARWKLSWWVDNARPQTKSSY